ncbi:MAG: hypothetical protein HYX90_01875 [Chloroflexi bacterium]|nr:hypothetical protein [Chloroflexota bacterium]
MQDKIGASGAVTLEVLNPCGEIETTSLHAPRLGTLQGKTIGELWNGLFRGEQTFPYIRESLSRRFADIKFVTYDQFPVGQFQIDSDASADLVQQKGCQAVIIGNGG